MAAQIYPASFEAGLEVVLQPLLLVSHRYALKPGVHNHFS